MYEWFADISSNVLPLDVLLIFQNGPLFLTGLWNTVILLLSSMVCGGMLAIPLGLLRVYHVPVLSEISWTFIYIERGSPLLIQLYLIYYGLGQFEAVRESIFWVALKEPYFCAFIALTLNTAAYTAEIVKGGILSIPKGEIEAALSVGLSRLQCASRIILPRAFRYAIPAYGNEVILLLHGTVVVSTITIIDILGAARTLNAKYYVVYEGFITAAFFYIILSIIINKCFRLAEKNFLQFLVK